MSEEAIGALDSLDLEVQAVVKLPHVGAGIQTVSSGRMISSLNHQAMSPAPPFPFLNDEFLDNKNRIC